MRRGDVINVNTYFLLNNVPTKCAGNYILSPLDSIFKSTLGSLINVWCVWNKRIERKISQNLISVWSGKTSFPNSYKRRVFNKSILVGKFSRKK